MCICRNRDVFLGKTEHYFNVFNRKPQYLTGSLYTQSIQQVNTLLIYYNKLLLKHTYCSYICNTIFIALEMYGYNSCHNMIVLGIYMAFILGSLDIVLDTLLIDVVVVVAVAVAVVVAAVVVVVVAVVVAVVVVVVVVVVAVVVIPTVDRVVIIIAGPVRNATGIASPLPIELVATTENV